MEREKMKSLTIRIESELIDELKKIAEAENRSMSSVVRLILKKGIKSKCQSKRAL